MVSRRAVLLGSAAVVIGGAAWTLAQSNAPVVVLGSTTTTENSGLLAWLLPRFEAETGIQVRTVVAGTGRVLQLAEVGDVDVSLTHDPKGEAAFITQGHGIAHQDVMFNDFLLVGPSSDPAAIKGLTDPNAALQRIAKAKAAFVSRGDDSGTDRKEKTLWRAKPRDADWYRETGAGMGATLNIAVASNAYTLVDRGTWAAFGNRGELVSLVEGAPNLKNQYGVILPAAIRPDARAETEAFITWLTTAPGQSAIGAFRIDGEQIFFPNAAQ